MRNLILFIVVFLTNYHMTKAQTMIQKAKYEEGDHRQLIYETVKYPITAIRANIEGDVILSMRISSAGLMDSLNLVQSPNQLLTYSALTAMEALSGNWTPTVMDDQPISKNYLMVFRFRKYLNSAPVDYVGKIESFIKKAKFSKALKFAHEAIDDNPFSARLLRLRSIIYKNIERQEDSQNDFNKADLLDREIMSVIDILALGKVTRTVITSTRQF